MKSNQWILEKIIEESVSKEDIHFIKGLIQEGESDEQVLAELRKKMFFNSKGMMAYIQQEKIIAATLKIAYRVHWTYIFPIIKQWLKGKEIIVRWREHKHGSKITKKAEKLRELLFDEYGKVRLCIMSDENAPEDVMTAIEAAAEDVIKEIEREEAGEYKDITKGFRDLRGLKSSFISENQGRYVKRHSLLETAKK